MLPAPLSGVKAGARPGVKAGASPPSSC